MKSDIDKNLRLSNKLDIKRIVYRKKGASFTFKQMTYLVKNFVKIAYRKQCQAVPVWHCAGSYSKTFPDKKIYLKAA